MSRKAKHTQHEGEACTALKQFSVPWWWTFIRRVERGDDTRFMVAHALQDNAWTVLNRDLPTADQLADLKACDRDSSTYRAWKRYVEGHGQIMPRPERVSVVYLPSTLPGAASRQAA